MSPHLPDKNAAEAVFLACCLSVAAVGLAALAVIHWFDRQLAAAVTGPVTS